MFHIFTDFPYAKNEQCGHDDSWYTKENVLANCSKHHSPDLIRGITELGDRTSVLDIGCGTGVLVEDLIGAGYLAAGIDGFYVYKKYLVEGWGRISNCLFTGDLGEEFSLCYSQYNRFKKEDIFKFDVILSSEFMEHLYIEQVPKCINNINLHLSANGIVMMEISPREQGGHHTTKDKAWWLDQFKVLNLLEDESLTKHFQGRYYRNLDDSHKFVLTRQK